MHTDTQPSPADDLLNGVKAISGFIGEPVRRTNYLLETNRLPAGKIGARWVASKTRLRQFYAELTAGGRAA